MRGIKRNHGIENEPAAYGLLAGLAVLWIAMLAIAQGGCAHSHHLSLGEVQKRYDAAVELTVSCAADALGQSRGGFGSGVIVSRDRLLTAAHMVGEGCTYVAEDARGELYLVRPLVVLEAFDLASMEIISPIAYFDFRGVTFGPRPRLGSTACAATAHPSRRHKCSEVYPPRDTPGDIVLGAIVEHGNSGSGLYDDNGALVGIVVHLTTCANGQICGGHASSLEKHIKELLPSVTPAPTVEPWIPNL